MVIDGDEISFDDLTSLSDVERKRVIAIARGRILELSTDIGYYGNVRAATHLVQVAYLAAELQCCIQVLLVLGFDPDKDNS